MKTTEIKTILLTLNSSNDMGFKYPIGNKELTIKVRELESDGKIYYHADQGRWVAIKSGDVFFGRRESN